MLEKRIEKKLVNRVKKHGGIAVKFVSPSMNDLPDRIIFLPGGKLMLIETKRPGKKPTKKQEFIINYFKSLGFDARSLNTLEEIDELFPA